MVVAIQTEGVVDYILITELMHRLLFTYKIIFLYIFRAINAHLQKDTLYTSSICYYHSLRECVPTGHHELS